jgi:rare lipoprotein A
MKYLKILSVCIPLTISGCTTTENYQYFPEQSVQTSEQKPLIVRRKTYATGIGTDAKKYLHRQVNTANLKGVQIKYEPYSRIGNADYTLNGVRYEVWNDIEDYQEIGIASWYGPGFHGEKTSNGEVYDQKSISAAHKNLPLPSYVKVTNLENNKSIVVRVNDRGPFHDGRVIDLSEGAANLLDVVKNGTAKVKLELIKVPEPPNAQQLKDQMHSRYIQVIATNDQVKANEFARNLRKKLSKNEKEIFVRTYTGMYKVYLGPFRPNIAEKELEKVRSVGYPNSYLLYLD